MTLFIVFSILLIIIAVAVLMPAMLNKTQLRNQDMEAENLRIAKERAAIVDAEAGSDHYSELEATLLDDLHGPDYQISQSNKIGIKTAVFISLLLPVAAMLLYQKLGNQQWLLAANQLPAQAVASSNAQTSGQSDGQPHETANIDDLISRLEQTLVEQPQNADGWALAARTYMSVNRFTDAENAYSRVQQLVGDDPDILTAWADASLMANGTQYTDEIADRINRALALEPNQVNALWIGGIGENSVGNDAIALDYLIRLVPLIDHDPQAASQVEFMIEKIGGQEALALLQEEEVTDSVVESATPSTTELPDNNAATNDNNLTANSDENANAGLANEITVSVSITPALLDQTKPTDLVFIFARAPNGPPFPLAATRIPVSELPAEVKLNDSLAMIPGQNISSVEQVKIVARVSKSGDPIAQPGDLTSEGVLSATAGQFEVAITVDQVVE